MQVGVWILSSFCLLVVLAAVWEAYASAMTLKRFPPPGRMVDIGGRGLHLHCCGGGEGPTVVIETGRFNTSVMWEPVQAGISQFCRVCTYDRAGYAWSDSDPGPRTGSRVAADLHTLLHKAEIPGPYLLVGHSLGAMYVRCFARQYPEEVAGVILVDPYTEGEVRKQPQKIREMQARFGRMARLISWVGILRLLMPFLTGMREQLHRFREAERARITALLASWRLWQAVDQEWREVEGLARELGGPGSLGDTPLLVLRAGRCGLKAGSGFGQAEVEALWTLMKDSQAELYRLSSHGRLVELPDTGHGVPLERPDVVVDAVREMLSRLLSGGGEYIHTTND